MPAEQRMDATVLDAVAVALRRTGAATLEASHELLAHYGDTGDAPTQRVVDTLTEHAADALRALTDSLADISVELESVATTPVVFRSPRLSRSPGERPSARLRPGPARREPLR
jgi:hypothetical protein